MGTLIQRLKKKRRKAKHVKLLRIRVAELHNIIFQRALSGNKPEIIEARLLKKYNRRLKLILY
jgi:hypothetical protein